MAALLIFHDLERIIKLFQFIPYFNFILFKSIFKKKNNEKETVI